MPTRDEILSASPDELNRLIALAKGYEYRMMFVEKREFIFGRPYDRSWVTHPEYHLHLAHQDHFLAWEQTQPYDGRDDVIRDNVLEWVPDWAGNIRMAWWLVEEMIGDEGQHHWYLESWGKGTKQGEWSATLFTGRGFDAIIGDGDTAPVAICRAYLLAQAGEH